MKLWRYAGFLLLLLILAGSAWLWWNKGAARRLSILTLQRLDNTMRTGDGNDLQASVSSPAAIPQMQETSPVAVYMDIGHSLRTFNVCSPTFTPLTPKIAHSLPP